MLGDRWSSTFTKSNSTLWPATYPVSEDYEKQPGVSDRPCPARRCRAQRRTESHWRWRGPSPPDWPWSPSWRASPRPPPRQSRPSSCASISRPRGQGWKPDKYQRCEGGGERGYKVKTDGFLGNSANESYFKLQQFFINVKLEWRKMLVGRGDGNIYQVDPPVPELTDIIVQEYLISIIYWVATITHIELRLSLQSQTRQIDHGIVGYI